MSKPFSVLRDKMNKSMSGPENLFEMKRSFQIEFLQSVGLLRKHTLLDFGCANLRGGLPLITFLAKGNYFGYEIRPKVLQEALEEVFTANLMFKEPSISDNLTDNQFDYVWCFSVLIHLENPILNATLKYIGERLSDDGVFYANVNVGNQPNCSWQGFPVVFRSLEFYKMMAKRNGMTCESIGTLKSLGHDSGNVLGDNQLMLKMERE